MFFLSFKKNFIFKQFQFFLSYIVVFLLIYLFTVSIVIFFHFLLDHSLGIIEGWIFYRGWRIIIFSKIVTFYIVTVFLTVNTNINLKQLIKDRLKRVSSEVYIILFFYC